MLKEEVKESRNKGETAHRRAKKTVRRVKEEEISKEKGHSFIN